MRATDLYVDTSVLVALCTHEAKTATVAKWYADCAEELAYAAWCVTEFASALGLKQRTSQLTQAQAKPRGCSLNACAPTICSCCRGSP